MNNLKNLKQEILQDIQEQKKEEIKIIKSILARRKEEYNKLVKSGKSYQARKLKGEIILYGENKLKSLSPGY